MEIHTKPYSKLVEKLLSVYRDKLVSIYSLDHPMARTADTPGSLLIVVQSVTCEDLEQHRETPGIVTQVKLFERNELATAADVFPIEFLELKRHPSLLYGKDVLQDVNVSSTHLRHELEFCLRALVLKLREGAVAPKADLSGLVLASFPEVLTYFGYVRHLPGRTTAVSETETFRDACHILECNPVVFEQIQAAYAGQKLAPYFEGYLAELTRAIGKLDTL
jgi:hypothetical protein